MEILENFIIDPGPLEQTVREIRAKSEASQPADQAEIEKLADEIMERLKLKMHVERIKDIQAGRWGKR